ncbi:tetraspanin-18 [Eurytemora carolleeae]|uniref:tetraspanin-18 n=1 Tax=Eurytemora carolleeae TaxID=1294199 RepID=UPI000C767F39|nr:tetraspanin-18 [Eurytemora carolleeae]|eukprot:XP_023342560.1 tetraspanin-18-like [Eurytemora affinis]
MGVKWCFSCLKYLIFTVNFMVFLLGLTIFCLSTWLVAYEQIYKSNQSVYLVYCILLSAGTFLLIPSFLGCCGAVRESACLLGTFFFLLLVLFLGEIILTVLLYVQEPLIREAVSFNVEQTISEKYENGSNTAAAWDIIQTQLECCGGDGPLDWRKSRFSGYQVHH